MSKQLRITHLYPELLNLYGDTGNVICMTKRLLWRGFSCDVQEVHVGEKCDVVNTDILFIGGGTDREQKIVADTLQSNKKELKAYVEDGGVLFAVCGGYQLLGSSYVMGDETIAGLNLVDFYTDRGTPRIIGNIAIQSSLCTHKIVGYENHGGRTHLASHVTPLGEVLVGGGNDGVSGFEGCIYKNTIGTYIHGPALPKNPELTDHLLVSALNKKYGVSQLQPLDDRYELEANTVMCNRLLR